MTFFSSTIDVLQTLVIALGGGLGVWGGINLLEGYGNDNPGANLLGLSYPTSPAISATFSDLSDFSKEAA